jgi:biopolymer transport protein ExbD
MKIRVLCNHCGKKLSAPAEQAGKQARCPGCGAIITVPAEVPPDEVVPSDGPSGPSAPVRGVGGNPPCAPRPPAQPLITKRAQGPDHDLIDMTAMVDIVFFLLIFFMVTSMHSLQSSISLPTPEAKPETSGAVVVSAAAEQVVVQIDADDTIAVDGEEVPSRQELIARLRDAEHDSLLVTASGEAMHGTVVMVLDAGSDAGMEQIRLVTEGLETD